MSTRASAGLAAFPGDGAKPEAVRVCSPHGLDLSEHRSQALTTDMVEAADHIYTMTLLQAAQLRAILPRQAAKIQPLSPAARLPIRADRKIMTVYMNSLRRRSVCVSLNGNEKRRNEQ